MADNRGSREKTIPQGMVSMAVGVDHVADRDIHLLFDEISDCQTLLWQSEGIDNNRPIRTDDSSSVDLGIKRTLEGIYVIGNSFS